MVEVDHVELRRLVDLALSYNGDEHSFGILGCSACAAPGQNARFDARQGAAQCNRVWPFPY